MKRWFAFSFCFIIALNSFMLNASGITINAIASLKEGWSDAYSRLLVDSTFESGNQIDYARAFAMNEGDFLYLKLDATDGAAPDGISPEGIEISTDGALFACFLNESVSSDYDENLYSFEYAIDRSFEGFTAEMCILYKTGIPDNISLTFVLTDNAGIKSARLPFSYTVPEEETVITTEETTVKTQTTTKKITTTARTTIVKSQTETQPAVIASSAFTTQTKSRTTSVTSKNTVSKKSNSFSQVAETEQVIAASESKTVTSGTVQTVNAGSAINQKEAQTFRKKKILATCGCAAAIVLACVAGTVNFKKAPKEH